MTRTSLQYFRRAVEVIGKRGSWHRRQIRCDRVRLGNDRARWCVCPTGLLPDSVVYSFGIGEDISFDLELIRRFGVSVHGFDPTPRSLDWLRSQTLPKEFIVHPYGLAACDGMCRFFPPENPSHISYSAVEKRNPSLAVDVPVQRLSTIMQSLGHNVIDLLKMDIEGAEYEVLSDLLVSDIKVHQVLVEFHHRWPSLGMEKTNTAIRNLNHAGYYIFDVSPDGQEYSFKKLGRSDAAAQKEHLRSRRQELMGKVLLSSDTCPTVLTK